MKTVVVRVWRALSYDINMKFMVWLKTYWMSFILLGEITAVAFHDSFSVSLTELLLHIEYLLRQRWAPPHKSSILSGVSSNLIQRSFSGCDAPDSVVDCITNKRHDDSIHWKIFIIQPTFIHWQLFEPHILKKTSNSDYVLWSECEWWNIAPRIQRHALVNKRCFEGEPLGLSKDVDKV